ncbi:Uncharacterised protein [Vibrio cholerae]|nr:Uncharacterised protein [Vibrio cholerae]CSB88298.1 Uncharacterised protein [Vibrio cholerae]
MVWYRLHIGHSGSGMADGRGICRRLVLAQSHSLWPLCVCSGRQRISNSPFRYQRRSRQNRRVCHLWFTGCASRHHRHISPFFCATYCGYGL